MYYYISWIRIKVKFLTKQQECLKIANVYIFGMHWIIEMSRNTGLVVAMICDMQQKSLVENMGMFIQYSNEFFMLFRRVSSCKNILVGKRSIHSHFFKKSYFSRVLFLCTVLFIAMCLSNWHFHILREFSLEIERLVYGTISITLFISLNMSISELWCLSSRP